MMMRPGSDPVAVLVLRAGTMADHAVLAAHHYLRREPRGISRVLVLEDPSPGVADRFLRRGARPRIVAVLVESYPVLNSALRDAATGGRYHGWTRGEAARLVNAEVRCISRVIVHPQWRGLGLAVRLVREALATATTPLTEAMAAMGRVHPFFALAGMTEYRRWPLQRDQRLLDAMASAGLEPWRLADVDAMERELDCSPLLERELACWAGRRRTRRQQLDLARETLLVEPVYYLWRRAGDANVGRALPAASAPSPSMAG